jgi:polyhydroxyalkanoate synthase subunit PhaC
VSAVQNSIEWAIGSLAVLDQARRRRGAWLDYLGFGPIQTPSRVLRTWPSARLCSYDQETIGPVLLIVPAPIKPAYIWDLAPDISVVGRCRAAGLRVRMLEWTEPDVFARLGLEDYIQTIIAAALDTLAVASGAHRAVLAGHSLGGTLAAITAALYPERVAGLVLIETPLRFGPHAGALAQLVAHVPHVAMVALGQVCVPGSLLSLAAATAAPEAFVTGPWLDWIASAANVATLTNHLRVERWALDELSMPGPLLAEIVERLYREDQFFAGTLSLHDRQARPERLSGIPLLTVIEPRSPVVPPGSALDVLQNLRMRDLRILTYGGDKGVALQHVGALVGPSAHRSLWPEIVAWIMDVARHE